MSRVYLIGSEAVHQPIEAPLATDDQQLLARLRLGEREALGEIAQVHGPRLLRLAHRLLGWSADAPDVVQEVFAKLLRYEKRLGVQRNLEAWLVAVTVNECRTHQRRWLAAWRFFRRPGVARHALPADSGAIDSETNQRVRTAVQKLPAHEREAVVLHYLEEMPIEQIAGTLGISRNAVEVRLHRARRKLREFLGDLMS